MSTNITFAKVPKSGEYAYCGACSTGAAKRSVCVLKRGSKMDCGLCATCKARVIRLRKERDEAEKRQREFESKLKRFGKRHH